LPTSVAVLVVGAGPIGLTVANLLGRMGVSVLVLERNPASLNIPRAIVLDDEGARTLQSAGVMNALLPLIVEGDGPLFFDDDGSLLARVGAGSREYGFCKRHFIHQPELEQVLKQGLSQCAAIDLRFEAEVSAVRNHPDHVEAHVNYNGSHHTIKAQILLACDGARSPTREALGVQMLGNTYGEDWLVVDTENDPDTSRNTKAFCRLDRPYMSIPAPRGGRRYEFKLLPGETRETMTRLDTVQRLLAPVRELRSQDVTRIAVYTFEARIADRLVSHRVMLLGDAAHLTPPFAGQGMNAGIRDASNVAWKVAMVVRGLAGIELLASYEVERRNPIKAMIQLAITMGEVIMPENARDKELRSMLLSKLSGYPEVREFIFGMKFKPRPRYDGGAFVGLEAPEVPASLVGCMIPQPILSIDGQQVRLDDIIGSRFALIAQSPQTESFAVAHASQLWPELDPVLISLVTRAHDGQAAVIRGEIIEADVALPLLAHRDQLMLVRPDRYVAAAFWPEQSSSVVEAIRHKLQINSAIIAK
jgi:3-(3-hydroxy-phenyl)propionate hydroxylase